MDGSATHSQVPGTPSPAAPCPCPARAPGAWAAPRLSPRSSPALFKTSLKISSLCSHGGRATRAVLWEHQGLSLNPGLSPGLQWGDPSLPSCAPSATLSAVPRATQGLGTPWLGSHRLGSAAPGAKPPQRAGNRQEELGRCHRAEPTLLCQQEELHLQRLHQPRHLQSPRFSWNHGIVEVGKSWRMPEAAPRQH